MIGLIALKTAGATKMLASLIPPAIPVALAQAGVIGEESGMSLAVVGAVIGGAWYLNGRLTKIEDGVDRLSDRIDKLPCSDWPGCRNDKNP